MTRARTLDAHDALAHFRDEFHVPKHRDGSDSIYLCGNSLGLQPKGVRAAIEQELADWERLGVEGHFHGKNPWYSYHEPLLAPAAQVVGAKPSEVALMNSLTTNLHLLMVSFYRPSGARRKILIEGSAFPSDRYAVASQARFHGLDPAEAVIELQPRPGEDCLRQEDIEALLEREGDQIALVLFGGVNYYTGQAFDMEAITRVGHAAGCVVGFDLAHAAGNLELALHDWGADFAAWCSYKYMNSGPGGISGLFVHERHHHDHDLPRFCGWWGVDPAQRFSMPDEFAPQPSAGAWQLSNAPVMLMAPHRVALDQFARAGMPALRRKAVAQTTFLLELLDGLAGGGPEVITPREPSQRGGQLSLRFGAEAKAFHEALTEAGVVCDFREPDCVRLAVAPLYTRFEDLVRFVEILEETRHG
ncbi:MAG: kynureninase [Myxococcota bacterium]|nr:kynureninase [Myxococcota bacterium]